MTKEFKSFKPNQCRIPSVVTQCRRIFFLIKVFKRKLHKNPVHAYFVLFTSISSFLLVIITFGVFLRMLNVVFCTSVIVVLVLHPSTSRMVEELCDDEPKIPNVCPFPLDGVAKNVAVNKLAEQSTKYLHGGDARLAVDGNTNQYFWDQKTCSHTAEHRVENETVPWLRVDLGVPHLVKDVALYARADPCCGDRYHNIQVRVGNYKEDGLGKVFSKNALCNELVGGGKKPGEIIHFDCPLCHAGRYVTVQIVRNCDDCKLPDYNILSICELEIMGYKV